MDLRSIAAVASGEADDAGMLAIAAQLAKLFSAHIKVIPAFPDAAADRIYYGAAFSTVPPEAIARIVTAERAQHQRIEDLLAAAAEGEGLRGGPAMMSLQKRELNPILSITHEAVLADLVVMGGDAARGQVTGELFAETLLSARAPVLLTKGQPFGFARAAIAWDGSAQAGRALRAALPLLRQMQAVFVLTNVDEDARGAGDGEEVGDYLKRHGVAQIVMRQVRGRNVPQSLLEAARADACELLVAGGYGRPRLYELVLGGATRAFVHSTGLPHLLLAH